MEKYSVYAIMVHKFMVPSLVKCMYKINAYFNQEESPLLPTPGGYVLGVFVYLSVCLFLCVHTNSKSNKQIFLKFLLWKKKILKFQQSQFLAFSMTLAF